MTYQEILTRAALAIHALSPTESLDRLLLTAQSLFPSIEEELAVAVAMNIQHPWRRNISDVTLDIADGALMPQAGSGGAQIIGVSGQVRDSADGKPLSESFVLEELRRLTENPNGWRVLPVYAYMIVKPRIYHTRPNVKIDVCVYDVAAQKAAIAADAVTLFPDAEGAYVTALTAKMKDPSAKFEVDLQGQVMMIARKA